MDLPQRLQARARELGFTGLAAAPALPYPGRAAFLDWLDAGHHADMRWLARDPERRADPRQVVEGAATVLMLWTPYPGEPEAARPADGPRGRIARYARGADYHDVLVPRLRELASLLEDPAARVYTDTGPVLERSAAERAGLGWIGKNGCLIRPGTGSWGLLGTILTRVPLPVAPGPHPMRCGTCTRCLEACPTGALVAPGVVDSRRCLSYLTIEHRGAIPRELRPGLGDRVFGCDICQEVCPWNRHPEPSLPELAPRAETSWPRLTELLELGPEAFAARFRGLPVKRAKRAGLARNAAIALGNAGDPGVIPALLRALREDPAPEVRGSAAWALGRLGAPAELAIALAQEPDPEVQAELRRALDPASGG